MTLTEYLAKVEERLKKATPGPWHADLRADAEVLGDKYPICYIAGDHEKRPADGNDEFCRGIHEKEDATLIANAPTDLAKLIAMLKVADEALDLVESHASCDGVNSIDAGWLQRRCSHARAEIEHILEEK